MKKSLFFLLAMAIFGIAQAQVTIENLINVPFPTELTASEDGNQLAWVFNDQGIRNIFLATAPDFEAQKLTDYQRDEGQEIASLAFSSDGGKIVFVRGGATNRQREFPNPLTLQQEVEQALWVINRDGSDQRKIGPGASPTFSPVDDKIVYLKDGQVYHFDFEEEMPEGQQLFKSRGNQTSLSWSPDGSRLAFVSRRGDHSFLGIYDLGSSTVTFMDPSVDHDSEPAWSADGSQIAFVRSPNRRKSLPFSPQREGLPWSIRIADISTGQSREVWKAPTGKGSIFHSLPGSNALFWLGNQLIFPWEGNGWLHLYAIAEDGGEPQLLTPGEGEVESAQLNREKSALLYISNIGDIDRRHIWSVSPSENTQQLTSGEIIAWSPAETANGLAFLGSDATTPAWPYHQPSGQEQAKLHQDGFPDFFPQDDLVVPEAIMVTATDGMEIPAQLFLPKDSQPGDRRPALIFTHGGPMRQMLLGFHYGLYYHHFYAMNQYFASQGYVVLSLNYRSGIGYGMEFREAEERGAAGASEYQDLEGAGLYLAGRDDVDPEKIALWGGSYGGYLTAMGLAKSPELFATGVDIHGVHDWNEVVRNFVPTYDSERRKAFATTAFEASPMHYIDDWRGPVLVIHGDDDRNVPFSETVSLVEELRERDVHVEQLIFPDEVHSFLLHQNWLKAFRASVDFLNRQLDVETTGMD